MFTDASGSESGEAACFLNGNWCSYPWPEHWKQESALRDLSFLEMVLVNLALYLMGSQWGNKKKLLHRHGRLGHCIKQTNFQTKLMNWLDHLC